MGCIQCLWVLSLSFAVLQIVCVCEEWRQGGKEKEKKTEEKRKQGRPKKGKPKKGKQPVQAAMESPGSSSESECEVRS